MNAVVAKAKKIILMMFVLCLMQGGQCITALCVSDSESIRYSTLRKGEGWKTTLTDVENASKVGSNLEAVKMELNSSLRDSYNIFYRVYLQDYGWLGWARNGETAGSIDANLNVQQVHVKIVRNDIVPQLEPSPVKATLVFDATRQAIAPSDGYRSKVLAIGTGNKKKFFKAPEYNVKNGINKDLWVDTLNIRENTDTKIRNVSASRIEKLLGISDVIAKSEYAILRRRGLPDVQGALIDNVENGMDWFPFRAMNNKTISPSLQHSLSNLMVFDGLTSQVDRCPLNHSIILSDNTKRVSPGDKRRRAFSLIRSQTTKPALRVVSYDQDCTFGNIRDLGSHFCFPGLVAADNKLTLPHMDKLFAKRILKVSDNQIRATLFDTLEPEYIEATISRWNQLKSAIKNTAATNPQFLLNASDWSPKTINAELSCPYGTYLKRFRDV